MCDDCSIVMSVFVVLQLHQREHEQTCLILIKHAVCDTSVLSWVIFLSRPVLHLMTAGVKNKNNSSSQLAVTNVFLYNSV